MICYGISGDPWICTCNVFNVTSFVCRNYLSLVHSPVVFCHNDLQGGNILLKRDDEMEKEKEKVQIQVLQIDEEQEEQTLDELELEEAKVMLIDFEFCGYNWRGFDLANHFCEWVFNYNHDEFPFYTCERQNFPSRKRQMEFFRAYLEAESKACRSVRSRAYSASHSTPSMSNSLKVNITCSYLINLNVIKRAGKRPRSTLELPNSTK